MSEHRVDPVLLAIISIGMVFVEARVFLDLWRWFVVPLGATQLTYWHAFGIGVLINMCVRANGVPRDTEKEVYEVTGLVLGAWGIGWLVSLGVAH